MAHIKRTLYYQLLTAATMFAAVGCSHQSAGSIQEVSFTYNIDFVTSGEVWDIAGVDTDDQITGTLRYDTTVTGTAAGSAAVDYNQTLSSGFNVT